MAYLNLFVGNRANINVKDKQLTLKNETETATFPLEDINAVLIENLQTNISTYTLSKLAEHGIIVYICNEQHIPNSYLLPFSSHFSQLRVYKYQSELPLPLKKQLWQDIVIHKILNQNKCLELCNKHACLAEYVKAVKSNDALNTEAVAANRYFKELFGKHFAREQENAINNALNYGYAILRGAIARNIVVHGLLPFLGLKHCNTLNSYNLADDLIEVFRPFVDVFVFANADRVLDKAYKADLFGLLNKNCVIQNSKYTLAYAIELYVQSFVDSLSQKANKLKFPTLCEIENHEYL